MESSNYVLACNKIDSLLQKKLTRVEVKTFNCSVEELASLIAELFQLNKDTFDIICFGKTLDFSKPLDSYGINKGIILYLTKKKESVFKEPSSQSSSLESSQDSFSHKNQEMCIALKSALLNPLFRKVLESLSEFEKRENLMAVNPELRSDPTLFGILSDSELLNSYINRNNIKRVLQRYPYFLEVATHISATFHEESSSNNPFHLDNLDRSAFLNYSIDAPSDDEMDESETSSISSTNTQASTSRITEHPTQSFSSMLMRAYQNRQQPQASSPVITQDMLRQALQNSSTAPASSSQSSSSSQSQSQPSNSNPSQESTSASSQQTESQPSQPRTTAQILIGWAPQLRQMRELGITDDIVAIQALEATNGDVQAAINIIFSDFN